MQLDQAKLQEYWDACLIKHWRKFGTLFDVINEYEFLTSRPFTESSLKRIPNKGMPWKIGVHVFVDRHLPKIGDRLNDQAPDKDVALLKKLQTSNYNTSKNQINRSKEIEGLAYSIQTTTQRNQLAATNIRNRNHNTDWNVTKGSTRIRRAR